MSKLGAKIIGVGTMLGLAASALLTVSVATPAPVAVADPVCPGSKGCVSTVAGTGAQSGPTGDGGPATDARFVLPIDLVRVGDDLFVADTQDMRVRRINVKTGIITTFAGTGTHGSTGDGGPATAAELEQPTGLAWDPVNPSLPADRQLGKGAILVSGLDGRIRAVDLVSNIITTVAGTGTSGFSGDGGPATAAQLGMIVAGIAVKTDKVKGTMPDNTIVFADPMNFRIRQIDAADHFTGGDHDPTHLYHVITTVVGAGVQPAPGNGSSPDGTPALSAEMVFPARVVLRPSDGAIVYSDTCDRNAALLPFFGDVTTAVSHCDGRIRVVNGDGTLGTIAGKAPTGGNFFLCQPGLDFQAPNDGLNSKETADPAATTGCGDGGPATQASIRQAAALRYDAAGRLFVGEVGGTFFDFFANLFAQDRGLVGVPQLKPTIRCVGCTGPGIISTYAGTTSGFSGDGGPATNAQFLFPGAIAPDDGTHVFVADFWNGRIRRIEGPKPDLRVSLSTDGALTAGGTGVVHVTVQNASTDPEAYLTGPVSATVTLPDGLSFASASVVPPAGMRPLGGVASWSCDGAGRSAVCTTPDNMAPQESSTFDVTVNVASDAPENVTVNANGSSDSDVADPGAQIAVLGISVRRSVSSTGYVLAGADGGTFAFGTASFPGAVAVTGNRVVGGAPAGAHGSWLGAADGSVFTTGDAQFHGSLAGTRLNSPVVGMAGNGTTGYWLVAADGGVFAEGSARFYGSLGDLTLNRPIVGMTATPSGKGYWLVASDGGVFAEGDARFYGSLGATQLSSPIVGMRATGSGKGYWLVAADGGVFAYGDAVFAGSHGDSKLNSPIVAIVPASAGYWLVAADGGVFAYGNATFAGSLAATKLNAPIVAAW
ncbi:MAG: hypothetical protein U0V73_15435 [Acidimicrobiia bacterium]